MSGVSSSVYQRPVVSILMAQYWLVSGTVSHIQQVFLFHDQTKISIHIVLLWIET